MPTFIENLEPVRRMAVLVFILLILASLVVRILRRVRPDQNFTELLARVRSWWAMAILFVAAVVLSPRLSAVFFGFVSFWAVKEYITLLKTRPADHGGLVLMFLSIPIQYFLISPRNVQARRMSGAEADTCPKGDAK